MVVKASFSSPAKERWYEYVIRFVLGGAATAFAAAISSYQGPSIGGLFLAMPVIFCAGATLIETHARRRKQGAGLKGDRRGQKAAGLDAAGAALGSLGLLAFAATFTWLVESSVTGAFVLAIAAFGVVSVGAWWLHRTVRITHRHKNLSAHRAAQSQ